jgi:transcriptional regulator with XRE-family HTH domain
MEFGWRLREIRKDRGISLRALAGKVHKSYSVLSRIESGESPGTVDLAQRCDEALGSGTELADLARASDDTDVFGPNLLQAIRAAEGSDVDRRSFLKVAASSMAASAAGQLGATRRIEAGDVVAVRDMISWFSRADQRHGGGHARRALTQYLMTDVLEALTGKFQNDNIRRQLFAAASEGAYLAGWMGFDDGQHNDARRAFELAVEFAGEAEDGPLRGHVLRAMAHQANDLRLPSQALRFSGLSMGRGSYEFACPRERSLLGVVHARALVSSGDNQAASRALLQSENDLSAAASGDEEPDRVFFFGEASLAHETACALRDMGDLQGAIREFKRSIELRKAQSFTRTHAVTLGYLAEAYALSGNLEAACGTWSEALDTMNGIRSSRVRNVLVTMTEVLDSYGAGVAGAVADLRSRAHDILSTTAF